jgi:hypothetical protein
MELYIYLENAALFDSFCVAIFVTAQLAHEPYNPLTRLWLRSGCIINTGGGLSMILKSSMCTLRVAAAGLRAGVPLHPTGRYWRIKAFIAAARQTLTSACITGILMKITVPAIPSLGASHPLARG